METLDKETFRSNLKRLFRQLDHNQKRSELSYQNKRKEFISLIDNALKSNWFTMPGPTTRIYKIYHDSFD